MTKVVLVIAVTLLVFAMAAGWAPIEGWGLYALRPSNGQA